MKKIGIMADSHSGILKQEAEELDIHVLPMPFSVSYTHLTLPTTPYV